MTPTDADSSPPPTLGAHHLRLFALLIDYLLVVIALNLLRQLLLGESWDLRPLDSRWGSGPGYWLVAGGGLLLIRDALFGRSPGKWLMGIAVGRADRPHSRPGRPALLLRNVPLLILPVEAVLVFTDPYSRRLGDRWAGTVVIAPVDVSHLGRRMLVFSSGVLAVLLVAFLVTPWNMRRSAAYRQAVQAIETDPAVIRRAGGNMEVVEHGGFDLELSAEAGRATLNFQATGDRGLAAGTVTLAMEFPARRWRLVSLTLEEPPALSVEDAAPSDPPR